MLVQTLRKVNVIEANLTGKMGLVFAIISRNNLKLLERKTNTEHDFNIQQFVSK